MAWLGYIQGNDVIGIQRTNGCSGATLRVRGGINVSLRISVYECPDPNKEILVNCQ